MTQEDANRAAPKPKAEEPNEGGRGTKPKPKNILIVMETKERLNG